MEDRELIADLVRAGVAADLVNRVALALIASRDASRDASRSVTVTSRASAAERARRYRENRKQKQNDAKANDVASGGVLERDGGRDASRDGVTALDSIQEVLSINGTQKLKQARKVRSESARAREDGGTRMVEGALLPNDWRHSAIEEGAPIDKVDAWWAEFVRYWIALPGRRGRKSNWKATWLNRVQQRLENGNGYHRSEQRSLSERAADLAQQIRARESAAGARRQDELF